MRALSLFTLFLYLVLGGIFYWVYQQLNRSPCETPIGYRITQVDANFNINQLDVERYARQAAQVWNEALGLPLLQERADGELTIRLIYDQRQANTNFKKQLENQVQARKEDLDNIKLTFNQIKQEYDRLGSIFTSDQAHFQARLNQYNDKVAYINRLGGADPTTGMQLEQERSAIESERRLLDSQLETLRIYERRLQNYSQDHNQIVDDVKQKVDVLNKDAGQEFQEGNYNPKTNQITIFEYKNIDMLKRVLTHEMGHALGIQHVTNPESIMYYLNNRSELQLSNQDITALKEVCKLE